MKFVTGSYISAKDYNFFKSDVLVPMIIIVAGKYDVHFTFFLNCGKSVLIINSLKVWLFSHIRKNLLKSQK